jgi:ABC-type glutathione transport system ATPase component
MLSQVSTGEPLVIVQGLSHCYQRTNLLSRSHSPVQSLSDVNLSVRRGSTLAVIGESGAGKSTLARCMALLETPTTGKILLDGRNMLAFDKQERFRIRRKIQLVFQDPTSSLNPRLTAAEIISEPLVVQREGTRPEQYHRALELMDQVGLAARYSAKRPLEFSGGQRQRLAIARALALKPSLLILDEALSSLDLENQELIVQLLTALQTEFSLTFVHISHDLDFVKRIADEIAVMYRGRIVEQQPAAKLVERKHDSYSQKLFSARRPVNAILAARFQGAS